MESGRLGGELWAESDGWGSMLPELLGEIIKRVEESEDRWPQRQSVVACACVCKKWRDVTKDIVKSLPNSSSSTNNASPGKITFPSCLKQVRFFIYFGEFLFIQGIFCHCDWIW